MTYNELKRKHLLREITEEEYQRGKEKLIQELFDRYEECIISEKDLTDRLNIIKEKEKGLS